MAVEELHAIKAADVFTVDDGANQDEKHASDDDMQDADYEPKPKKSKAKKAKVVVAAPAAAAPRDYVVIDSDDDDLPYEITAPSPITDAERAWLQAQRAKIAASNAGNGAGGSGL